ncbi:MAG: carboxypeptidase-like regulatory domain-containing protein [Alphaproteobacteria bacterium]|nr:carboxypeptidase-like regulatory domain-containing protein [Alphaproteobacteria bacterium]
MQLAETVFSYFRRTLVASALLGIASTLNPGPVAAQVPAVDRDDIGGVVTGPNGPEAGVWVIAETKDLKTRYAKMVVTDDQGRFVVPDLPKASYDVWVRGYGLVDSPKVRLQPGSVTTLEAVPAPNAAAAANYYPAIHWYSMLRIPGKDQFGGKSDIPKKVSQSQWLHYMKNNGCVGCHQMGNEATRTIPAFFKKGRSSIEAWMQRIQAGQAGGAMVRTAAGRLGGAPFKYFAEWTDAIAKGALPHTKPDRPQGVERNIVVTVRDWLTEKHYLHDLISTDKRYPTVNPYGPVYGSAEFSTDMIPILDPRTNTATMFKATVRKGTKRATAGHAKAKPVGPSAYWGMEEIWNNKSSNHNPMIDKQGRVWFAARVRDYDTPAFCRKGSSHPSAKLTPLKRSTRHLSFYDPKTKKYTMVETCFSTHHLQFGFDKNDTLWTSGGRTVIGWLDSKKFLETGDAAASQGWTAVIIDTNGNGKRDEGYTTDKDPVDPTKDMRIRRGGLYAVMPSPIDDSVWGTVRGYPGAIVRLKPGNNPPATALAEIYKVPKPGFAIRGGDIDSKGVVWVSLGSGHMGAFDRRKCKGPLNGPKATGDHCPEGWSFYQYPGPGFKGIGPNSAESSYFTWVDQHDTFGLGKDVPMSTGNLNDGLSALKDGKMVTLRVPYPMGFFAKGLDGRIDDAKAGWKGRGLWTTSGDRTPWHYEGGKGTKPLVVHFQLRPNPLAK